MGEPRAHGAGKTPQEWLEARPGRAPCGAMGMMGTGDTGDKPNKALHCELPSGSTWACEPGSASLLGAAPGSVLEGAPSVVTGSDSLRAGPGPDQAQPWNRVSQHRPLKVGVVLRLAGSAEAGTGQWGRHLWEAWGTWSVR